LTHLSNPVSISGNFRFKRQIIEKCDTFSGMQIFIDMKKPKHLSIRLTVEQFRKLADNLVIEQKSKSLLMREIIEDYLDGNKLGINKQDHKKNDNQKP
jgi:hypothetical protein